MSLWMNGGGGMEHKIGRRGKRVMEEKIWGEITEIKGALEG